MSEKYYSENYQQDTVSVENTDSISGSGGGGCFPAGTLVRTGKGFRPIDLIRVGDSVVSYDRFGVLELGYITEKIVHAPYSYKDKLYFVYSKEVLLFPEGITGNHAVYDPSTKEHKQISEFKVGECLEDFEGKLYPITRINRLDRQELPVYNLLVEPQHTYTVAGIKVHNGGGGKSSGSPRAAQEAPNTLQSSSIASILEVISHGEIEGIIGGEKGVTFNSTVLQNLDNSYNFSGIEFEERTGLPTQLPIDGFAMVEGELALPGTTITSAGVVEDLVNSNVDYARVTIRMPEGLWKQNKTNGDLEGYTVGYAIQVRDYPLGSFTTVLTKVYNDKTTSAWEVAHRIKKPDGATQWSIKVIRTTPEDSSAATKSIITLARITELTDQVLAYDKIAYVGLRVPAEVVGNKIPVRAYQVKGIKVKVPANYDTVLRTYGASYWNGVFKTAWTDNTAWVLYDLITDEEYGMNRFLNQPIDVDIWAFYEASLYCDAATWNTDTQTYSYNLLDDGQGGTEVRYTFNAVIQVQQSAWQLLHAIASNMRAILVMKGNQISLIQDRPKLPVKLFNNSNVLEGLFTYSGTESTSRATAINCTFNDKLDRYLPRTISEEDSAGIDSFGYNVKDLVAYGAVTESQARRMAKWALYTEIHQPELVSFAVALNIVDIEVGDVVSVMDDDYISDTNDYLTGRVVSISGTTVILGNDVTLATGHTYNFGVMSPDYSEIVEGVITTPAGTTNTLTLNTALPAGDYTNHEFFCYSSGFIEPRNFLIQSITENEKGRYTIAGLFFDNNKFAAIEQGIVVPPGSYTNLIATVVPAVTNIRFNPIYVSNGLITDNKIIVEWDWENAVDQPDQVTYRLRWRRDNNNYVFVNDIASKRFEIPSIVPGTYDVWIEAQNLQGKSSLATFSTYAYRTTAGSSTLLPPENFFVKDTTGVAFTGTHIPVTWTFPTTNEDKEDTLLDYQLEAWSTDGLTLLSTHLIQPDSVRGGSFTYTLEMNRDDYVTASRSVQLRVYSRDTVGELSIAETKTFTNATPTSPAFSILSGNEAAYIDITPLTDVDIAGYELHRSETTGFTPNPTTLVADGFDSYIALKGTASTQYFYRVGAYDTFGKTGMVYGAEQSSTMLSGSDVPIWVFDGLIFKPNDPAANRVSWTAGSASLNGAAPITINAGSSATAWTSGIQYFYYDGSSNTISVTTDLSIAVTGAMVLATYKGGTNLIVGNGDAYTDGGLILANTVGANQLVADSAIITNTAQIQGLIVDTAHINNGAVVNAKIGQTIQSTNFSDTTFDGWKIDKAGNLTSYGALDIRDSNNNVILTTGASARIEWNRVLGTGRPADNATNNARGSNLLPNAGFYLGLDPWTKSTSNWGTNLLDWYVGAGAVKQRTAYLGTTAPDVVQYLYIDTPNRVPVIPGQRLEFFCYLASHRCSVDCYIDFWDAAGALMTQHVSNTVLAGTALGGTSLSGYEKAGAFVTVPANAVSARFLIRKYPTQAPEVDSYIFATLPYVGVADANQTEFSEWSEGVSGSIQQITPANVSTYVANLAVQNAQIADLAVNAAKIQDLAVDTLKIKGRAVTIPTAAATLGTLILNTSWQLLQEVTYTTEGFDALITFSSGLVGRAEFWAQKITALHGTETVFITPSLQPVDGNSYSFLDITEAGQEVTYRLYARLSTGGFTGTAFVRSIVVLEVKR